MIYSIMSEQIKPGLFIAHAFFSFWLGEEIHHTNILKNHLKNILPFWPRVMKKCMTGETMRISYGTQNHVISYNLCRNGRQFLKSKMKSVFIHENTLYDILIFALGWNWSNTVHWENYLNNAREMFISRVNFIPTRKDGALKNK